MPTPTWNGRFAKNEIISLLDVGRAFNLAESTTKDLTFGELLDMVDTEAIRDLSLGYGTASGNAELRSVIGEATGVAAHEVITTQGTALGLFLLAFELCRPGDEVVLLTPCFPPSRDALVANGVTVVEVPTRFDDGFRIDVGAVTAALSPATRLVSIATPQNPTGVSTPAAEIAALLESMAERAPDAFLFVDETYREAVYGTATIAPSVASLDARVITAASISKALGAPGLRTGWLTVRDPELLARLQVAKMNTVISGSVLDEALAAILLRQREMVLSPRRALLAEALDHLARWCDAEISRIEWVRPDAGALCCMRLRQAAYDDDAVERFWGALADHDLQLAGGDWFGASRRMFRLGFGYLPLDRFPAALEALSRALAATQDP